MKFKLYASATLVAIAGLLGATQASAKTYTVTDSSWGQIGSGQQIGHVLIVNSRVVPAKRIKMEVSVSNLPAGAMTRWALKVNNTTARSGNGPGTFTTDLASNVAHWKLNAHVLKGGPKPAQGTLTNKVTVITP